jgi:fructokinase
MPGREVLCVGEVLWDALPAGLFLGGAPFNVACHLRAAGVPVAMASRVGDDRLGEEVLRRAAQFGIATDLLQVDPELPTGFVRVTLDETGEASFDIVSPAAWDAIAPTPELLQRAADARAIVFGTLAQRAPVTRGTHQRLWDTEALLVFDANLRAPHDDPAVVRRSLEHADVVKVSARELRRVAEWFDLPPATDPAAERTTAAALAERFGCATVCVTRGGAGAALWRDGTWTEHRGFEVEVQDTVGAGDAFLAVLLSGLLSGADARAALEHANLIGAYVATQRGAVPPDQPSVGAPLPPSIVPAPPADPAVRPRRASPRVASRRRDTSAD